MRRAERNLLVDIAVFFSAIGFVLLMVWLLPLEVSAFIFLALGTYHAIKHTDAWFTRIVRNAMKGK